MELTYQLLSALVLRGGRSMCLKSAAESTNFPYAAIEEAIVAVMQAERNYTDAALAL